MNQFNWALICGAGKVLISKLASRQFSMSSESATTLGLVSSGRKKLYVQKRTLNFERLKADGGHNETWYTENIDLASKTGQGKTRLKL